MKITTVAEYLDCSRAGVIRLVTAGDLHLKVDIRAQVIRTADNEP